MKRALFILGVTVLCWAANAGEREVRLERPWGTLSGTLTRPDEAGDAVALLIAGSGPTDRDGNNPIGGRNDALKKLAWRLAQSNIASVRFDKRGIAQSQPAGPHESKLSLDQYVTDAVAWGEKLKSDPRFGKVFVLGHSEGALIASLAAPRKVLMMVNAGAPVDDVIAKIAPLPTFEKSALPRNRSNSMSALSLTESA